MAKRKGTKAARLTAKKANRKRIAKARIEKLRQERLVVSPRMRAKREAREMMLEQIELDQIIGLEDGKVCRKRYKALCNRALPRRRIPEAYRRFQRHRANHARPSASYRGHRLSARNDMAQRRGEQQARATEAIVMPAPVYNLDREMARRQRQSSAVSLKLAA